MTESSKQTVAVPKGTPVGICPDCGPVCGSQINVEFPLGSECDLCGTEIPKIAVTDEQTEVDLSA